MASPIQQSPYILYSDGEGNIYEDTSLYVVGRSGWDAMPIDPADWIELPEGGNLYELPGRRGIGLDVELCTFNCQHACETYEAHFCSAVVGLAEVAEDTCSR
jgi:hypothetical protein